MRNSLEFELNDQKYIFKNKKDAFSFLEKKPSLIKALEEKYVLAYNYKHIKNIYQYVFNYFSNKEDIDFCGKCVMCGGNTKFNILTNKYTRFDKPECIEKYKEQFKERMRNVHGREYYTQDPNALKHMLNSRTLTKTYSIGKYTYNVTGQYEEDFLDFMFYILKCNPEDLIECPFHIEYEFDGVKRIYMPDFYMPSLDLVIEIKSTKSAYAERDKDFEEAKRIAGINYMKSKNGNYYYLADKNYKKFLEYMKTLID